LVAKEMGTSAVAAVAGQGISEGLNI